MPVRQIEISFENGFNDATDNVKNVTLHSAIGYFTTWAINNASDRYRGKMSLNGDKEGNLYATYRNTAGEVTYTMFGQLSSDDYYSFHS